MSNQTVSADARLEDLEFMASTGENPDGAAARLGLTRSGLERWLAAHDRWDVHAALTANGRRRRVW